MNDAETLPLPNLTISGFRGIKKLKIPRLGKVTLLTGKNGIGKTTTLEAVRLWAARGSRQSIVDLLSDRGEITVNRNGKIGQYDATYMTNLFWGRDPIEGEQITIGPYNGDDNSKLRLRLDSKYTQASSFSTSDRIKTYEHVVVIERLFADSKAVNHWSSTPSHVEPRDQINGLHEDLPCVFLGSNALENRAIMEFRDKMALTEDEELAIDGLNSTLSLKVNKIAAVGEGNGVRLFTRLEGVRARVPLASLGDGAVQVFGIALAFVSSKNGLLLMDDIGNGIHYSLQERLWSMICQTAQDLNVQVISTTHSFDCVKGFAEAAVENENVDGVLVRIEEGRSGLNAVSFDESELEVVARRGIEVR